MSSFFGWVSLHLVSHDAIDMHKSALGITVYTVKRWFPSFESRRSFFGGTPLDGDKYLLACIVRVRCIIVRAPSGTSF